jgi:sodium/potassium-transporting ATPase subunit alpha
MSKVNVLVKDLQGVETLGAITLLATDKTGTLTRNQMTATMIWTNFKMFKVDKLAVGDEEPMDTELESTKDIGVSSIICSRARFAQTNVPLAERSVMGDATECGLLRFACKFIPNHDTVGASTNIVLYKRCNYVVCRLLTRSQKCLKFHSIRRRNCT